MGQADILMAHDGPTVIISDRDLLGQIILTAKIALTEAENFREDYVQKTFSADFEQHHQLWRSQRYDWLPNVDQIPKNLGEVTPSNHLEALELDESLLNSYEYLQTIAVGLEQLVWDQEDEEAPFYGKFKDMEFKLRALLCEIQVAILERGIVMRPDVRRDVMTEAFRNMNRTTSSITLRDWLIFRDFMNALEYVIQVFNFLQETL